MSLDKSCDPTKIDTEELMADKRFDNGLDQSRLDIALGCLRQGLSPIPLGFPTETPTKGFLKRFDDENAVNAAWPKNSRMSWNRYQSVAPTEMEVSNWCAKWPNAKFALLTGKEICVVDADSKSAILWVEENLPKTPCRVEHVHQLIKHGVWIDSEAKA